MQVNVAGTNAVGGYLVSKIQNTRILFGEDPGPGYDATPIPTPGTSGSGTPAATLPTPVAALPTHAQLQAELSATRLSNAQTLFGLTPSASGPAAPNALPAIAGQTPHQIEMVGIESSLISQQFQNVATLFGSLGVGANLDRSA